MEAKMTVWVNGNSEVRAVDSCEYIELADGTRHIARMIPELKEGEMYVQTVDGETHIVKGVSS